MISRDRGKQKCGPLAEEGPECLWGGTRGGGSEQESGRSLTVTVTSKTARPKGRAAATRRK